MEMCLSNQRHIKWEQSFSSSAQCRGGKSLTEEEKNRKTQEKDEIDTNYAKAKDKIKKDHTAKIEAWNLKWLSAVLSAVVRKRKRGTELSNLARDFGGLETGEEIYHRRQHTDRRPLEVDTLDELLASKQAETKTPR